MLVEPKYIFCANLAKIRFTIWTKEVIVCKKLYSLSSTYVFYIEPVQCTFKGNEPCSALQRPTMYFLHKFYHNRLSRFFYIKTRALFKLVQTNFSILDYMLTQNYIFIVNLVNIGLVVFRRQMSKLWTDISKNLFSGSEYPKQIFTQNQYLYDHYTYFLISKVQYLRSQSEKLYDNRLKFTFIRINMFYNLV